MFLINWIVKRFPYIFVSDESIEFLAAISVIDNAAPPQIMEELLFDKLTGFQQKVVMKFYLSKYEFIDSIKPSKTIKIEK